MISLIQIGFLMSCESLLYPDDVLMAKDHYEAYQESDLIDYAGFAEFINTATLETSLSSVQVKVSVYDANRDLVEERLASGIIFKEDSTYVHIMTAFHVTEVLEGYTKTVRICDYREREFTGFVRVESAELGISAIRMVKPLSDPLIPIGVADMPSIAGEPVLLIGYQTGIVNAMTMGLITALDVVIGDDPTMYMVIDMPSDVFGDGGLIINLRHQLIGMQHHVETGEKTVTYAVMLASLKAFISSYEAS